jgi:hypothetical protein
MTEPSPRQFSLRTLLGVFWCVGIALATARQGFWPLCALGIPAAVLGFVVITGRFRGPEDRLTRGERLGRGLPVLVCAACFGVTLLAARPLDAATWMVFSGGVLWSLLFASVLPRARGAVPSSFVPVVFQALVLAYLLAPREIERFVPLDGDYIQDIRGGRHGTQFAGMRFGQPGPNTALLESYLGPLEPKWKHQCCLSPWVRDGNERVNSRSIIRRDYLPDVLAMLPDDEARRTVLACMTDPDNLLRVHQGLLLTCVCAWGYPPTHDAVTWWAKHGWVFHSERSARDAWRVMWGWREKIQEAAPGREKLAEHDERERQVWSQLRAAEYQERGGWGGDEAIAALLNPEPSWLDSSRRPAVANLGVDRIDWWP